MASNYGNLEHGAWVVRGNDGAFTTEFGHVTQSTPGAT